MSKVQELGERMADAHGFLGVPTRTFDEGGRRQFVSLLREGLAPESRICEIGCGCLRTAYWLIRFLEPERYCGIEPFRDRVVWGQEALFSGEMLREKAPRFDHNARFDTSVFSGKFDFFLAGSIWTHASKAHIETMLDGFLENTERDGTFLASYLPAANPEEDYLGETWVGTSHESTQAGIVRHSTEWIDKACRQRGLEVAYLEGHAFDDQLWLRVRRAGCAPHEDRLDD
jgi:hypothetical protein